MNKANLAIQITLSVTLVVSAITTALGLVATQDTSGLYAVLSVGLSFVVISVAAVAFVELWR